MTGTRPRPKDVVVRCCPGGAGLSLGNIIGGFRERCHVGITCRQKAFMLQTKHALEKWAQNTGFPPAVALSGPRTTKVERLRTSGLGPECPVSTRQDATARSRSSFAIVHFFRQRDLLSTPTRTKLVPGNSRNKRRRCPPGPNPTSETESHGERVLPRPPPPQICTGFTRPRQCSCRLSYRTIAIGHMENICMVEKWWKRWFMAIRARNSTQDRSRLPQGFTATLEASSAFLGSAKVMVRLESCE